MSIKNWSKSELSTLVLGFTLMLAPAALAQSGSSDASKSTQTGSATTTGTRARTVSSGERMKITGVVTARSGDTATVRDLNGVDTIVRLSANTNVSEKKSNPFRGAKKYGTDNIIRGLNVEVEGRGDAGGQLVAEKIRVSDTDLRVARSIESRVDPVESRVGSTETKLSQVEQNAQRLSGQIDELAAVSNAAKGGAKAAQDTADEAKAGVNAANERISSLDDYVPQETAAVTFRVGSFALLPEAKTQLDTIATKALNAKGYVIEVTGYTDATGNAERNRVLSERRANAVIRYLVDNHRIPLRRIVQPYGYGASQPVADNKSREGRAQNRRVEVKVLVNKGLVQPTTTPATTTTGSAAAARP